ncbi:MAG: phosphoribosylformylglycinamidine cyclo-ligase, partial [Deltaproteobacteria bacterium]|nr:phosphoribosylformylglycinamidine cyclo-ligase [Deltaproteobacteria bacterium]
GVVDRNDIVDGSSIQVGEVVIGIASNGLHSNGYSLARKIVDERIAGGLEVLYPEIGYPLGEALLRPTRIYVKAVLNLLRDFKIQGMAHITGGGLLENVPRILPRHCCAVIEKSAWPKPALFEILREAGQLAEQEIYRTFNYGIGMVLVVPKHQADDILLQLNALHEEAWVIGEITASDNEKPSITLV